MHTCLQVMDPEHAQQCSLEVRADFPGKEVLQTRVSFWSP